MNNTKIKLSATFLLIGMIGTSSVPAGSLPIYTLRPLAAGQNKAGAEELTDALRDKTQNPPVVADQALLEAAQGGPLFKETVELATARAALGTRAGQEEKPEDFTVQKIGRLKRGSEVPAVPYTNGFLTGLAYAVADAKDRSLSDSAGGYLRSLPPGIQTVVQKTAELIRQERFSKMDMKVLQYSDGTPLAGLSGRDVAQFLYSVYVQGAEPRLKSRDYAAVVVSNEGSDLQVVAIPEAGISDRFADSLGRYLIDRVGTGIFSIDGRLEYTVYQVGAYNRDYSLPKQYLSDAQDRTGPYLLVQLDIPARAAAGQEEQVAALIVDENTKPDSIIEFLRQEMDAGREVGIRYNVPGLRDKPYIPDVAYGIVDTLQPDAVILKNDGINVPLKDIARVIPSGSYRRLLTQSLIQTQQRAVKIDYINGHVGGKGSLAPTYVRATMQSYQVPTSFFSEIENLRLQQDKAGFRISTNDEEFVRITYTQDDYQFTFDKNKSSGSSINILSDGSGIPLASIVQISIQPSGAEENVDEAAARLRDEPIKVVETLPGAALLTADAKAEVVRYLLGQIDKAELLGILDRLGIVEIQSGGAFMNQAELIRDAAQMAGFGNAAGQEEKALTVAEAMDRLNALLFAYPDQYEKIVFNSYKDFPGQKTVRVSDVGNDNDLRGLVYQFSNVFPGTSADRSVTDDGRVTIDLDGDTIHVNSDFRNSAQVGLEERRRIKPGSGMRALIGVVLGIAAVPLLFRFAEEKGNVPARLRGENPPVIQQLERIEPAEVLNPPAAPVFTKVETVETFKEQLEPVALEPTRAAYIFTKTTITYTGVPGMEIPGTGLRVDGFSYQDKGAAAIVPDALVSSGLVDAGRSTILIPASVVSPGTVVFAQAGVLSDEVVAKLRDQKVDIRTFTDLKNLPGDPEQGDVYLLDVPLGEERGVVRDRKDVVINFHPAGADKRIISSSDLGALILAAQNQADLTLRVSGIRYSEQFSGLMAIDTGA